MQKTMIPIVVVWALLLLTGVAAAAQWQFYGSARMATFDINSDVADLRPEPIAALPLPLPERDDRLRWRQQLNSRVGANVSHGPVSGRFEFGTGVNVRHLYGVWDYDVGQLLVGQSFTPLGSYAYSNQVFNADDNLYRFGQVFNGRRPMVELVMDGFKVALVRPHAATGLKTGGDVDLTYPKLEIAIHQTWDNAFLDLFGGYQTYEINGVSGGLDVDAYVFGLGAGVTAGPGFVKGGVYWARNAGQYGLANAGFDDAVFLDGRLVDNNTVGGLLVVGCRFGDHVGVEMGAGMTRHELEDDRYDTDESIAVYLQLPLTLAPGVSIVPEVGHYDFRQDLQRFDEGYTTYIGAKWQVNF